MQQHITNDDQRAKSSASNVREHYSHTGWTLNEESGLDIHAFVDTRAVPLEYAHKCMKRLNTYFRKGGQYLLDAGSGPIPHDELLSYSDAFEKRLCLDFSLSGLQIAKSKLGEKGICILGDITNIPLKSGTIDAVTCNHVLYHVAADQQKTALLELWRRLRPGGIAVIVYAWARSPIALYYHAHSLKWFESQEWLFRYRIDTFRVVDNEFLRQYIGDGRIGQLTLRLLYLMQTFFPRTCGKYGQHRAIVIYKE